jgi:protein-tyrosine phosphatase
MIDIHTHILPQVDDGPSDWEDALALIRQGMNDGIRGAVCTSHVLNKLDDNLEGKLIYRFDQLKEMVAKQNPDFKLWLGSELHILSSFDPMSQLATINGNKKYLMIEFPMNEMPSDADDKLFQLTLNGFTPILVHPERNAKILYRPEKLFEFVQRGILVQVNAGSINGVFGRPVKKLAMEAVDRNLVHFVASDCHQVRERPMLLSEAYRTVEKRWGGEKAQALFHANPLSAVQGDPIPLPAPESFDVKKRKSFFSFGKR